MPALKITRRPVVLATQPSATMLAEILGRIESIRGRAARYGVTNPVAAADLMANTVEADFAGDYYRNGYGAPGESPDRLPSWDFDRTGFGYGREPEGGLTPFASGTPRVTGRGLLVEPQRTNYLLYSSTFSTLGWSHIRASASVNAAIAPDGTGTATAFVEDATPADSHAFVQAATLPAGAACMTVYVEPAGRDEIYFLGVSGLPFDARFDLTGNGAVLSVSGGDAATIDKLPGGIFRIVIRFVATGNGTIYIFSSEGGSTTLNGLDGNAYYLWGSQLESGAYPTSYIPTTSATATRGMDYAQMAHLPAGDFTVLIEADLPGDLGATLPLFCVLGSTINDRVTVYGANGPLYVASTRAGTEKTLAIDAGSGARRVRVAVTSASDSVKASVGGAAPSKLIANRPIGLAHFWFGSLGDTYNDIALRGYIRTVLIIPRLMSDAELQGLSA